MDTVEVGYPAETLGRLPGMDVFIVADDPDLIGIPGVRRDIMIIVAPEMTVFEQDPIHGSVFEQLLAALSDPGKVFFVHHFVALDIKQPVARTGFFGDVRLMGMFHPAGVFVQVPYRMDDPDLAGVDAPDLLERFVVRIAVADGYDEFVTNGEDRQDRLPDGIIEFGGITHHSKSADSHGPVFVILLYSFY
jgi:hypothetical protein